MRGPTSLRAIFVAAALGPPGLEGINASPAQRGPRRESTPATVLFLRAGAFIIAPRFG